MERFDVPLENGQSANFEQSAHRDDFLSILISRVAAERY
jgi:hypothetical protein